MTASVLAGISAVAGVSVATAGPAAAADRAGVWRAYGNTNPIDSSSSRWYCAGTKSIASDVGAQVCGIKAPSGIAIQTAVIVRNNRSSSYAVEAAADLTTPDTGFVARWVCSRSAVARDSWSVCFGETREQHLFPVEVRGGANGVNLGLVTF
ncbi:hypothetical protein ACPCHT_33405 [Nucisporomicrobium flavum]|uniref:hypothetical protein n=1 Tax=Nucisporomicrobium flavum TaxID=2785915 RepID=UPI0018F2E9FF|nr:hypothetical protein [Nucisporomicrobium flavum]